MDAENRGRDGGEPPLSSQRVQLKRDVDVQLFRGLGAKALGTHMFMNDKRAFVVAETTLSLLG